MQNITYLLGAGASFHSMPLINGMNTRMKIYSKFLRDCKKKGLLKHKDSDLFISKLDEIILHESENTSIDTYAKILHEGRNNTMELVRLKAVLSSYLIFEQLQKPQDLLFYSEDYNHDVLPAEAIPFHDEIQNNLKTVIDKRYKAFFAHLLSGGEKLPDNVKILSWNYDMQLEAAYSNIKGVSLRYAQQTLQVFPSELSSININGSCVLKLNGTAGLSLDATSRKYSNWFDLQSDNLMDCLHYLIDIFATNYTRTYSDPQFYFAWENEGATTQTRSYAKSIIEETDALVVIGYSFPYFNKEVDRDIFANIDRLSKLYYQAPESDLSELIDNLDNVNTKMKDIAIRVPKLDTFKIPTGY